MDLQKLLLNEKKLIVRIVMRKEYFVLVLQIQKGRSGSATGREKTGKLNLANFKWQKLARYYQVPITKITVFRLRK